MIIGTKLRHKRGDRAVFTVVGVEGGGHYVLAPDVHGPAISASELELSTLFTILSEPDARAGAPTPSVRVLGMSDLEAAGRERLRARMERQAAARARSPQGRTPEEVFADAAGQELR